jgi:hypothetical protein
VQPTSAAFQAAIQGSNQSVAQVNIIQDNKIVMILAAFDGAVTADGTAANQRTCSVSVGDEDGSLTPADISGVTAPFGTRMQILRGVTIEAPAAVVDLDNSVVTWAQGTNNGTIGDPTTGALVLGWTP